METLEQLDKLTEVENNTEQLSAKLIDMGGRGCRNNIRIQGLGEKAEGKDPVCFFELWDS